MWWLIGAMGCVIIAEALIILFLIDLIRDYKDKANHWLNKYLGMIDKGWK